MDAFHPGNELPGIPGVCPNALTAIPALDTRIPGFVFILVFGFQGSEKTWKKNPGFRPPEGYPAPE